MNYKQKLNTEILYYTGYQLEHTLDKLNLMVDDLDVKIDSSKHINEIKVFRNFNLKCLKN